LARRALSVVSSRKMEYRFLGRSGLRVSVLSLGAWLTYGGTTDKDVAYECMKAAHEMGCNFYDNAEVYAGGNAETVMGHCLQRFFTELNVKRSDLVIATKVYWGGKGPNDQGLSRKHITEGINASLKRLQLDYVDLYFCHRPDAQTPIEETVRAMNFVIDQGKALYWGTSEWSAEQIMEARTIAKRLNLIEPLMEQPQYSMLHRTRFEVEYAALFNDHGMGSTIWSPLASGLLTGKYSLDLNNFPEGSRLAVSESNKWMRDQLTSGQGLNGLEEKDLETLLGKVDKLRPIAAKLGCSLAQLAVVWCLLNPHVSTVITGASRASQVVENFKSLEVLPKLTEEIRKEIEAVLNNKPTIKPPRVWRNNMP